MRHRRVQIIGMVCFFLLAAGCTDMFQSLDERGKQLQHYMKEHGVEFHKGKAMKVYRF